MVDGCGYYVVDVFFNGCMVEMLVDIGVIMMVLLMFVVERVGIFFKNFDFKYRINMVNGVMMGVRVLIDCL